MAMNNDILQAHDIRRRPVFLEIARKPYSRVGPTTLSTKADQTSQKANKTPQSFWTKVKLFATLCRIKYLVVTPFFISAALPYVLAEAHVPLQIGIWMVCLVCDLCYTCLPFLITATRAQNTQYSWAPLICYLVHRLSRSDSCHAL